MEKGTIQELNTVLQNQHKCPTEKYGGPMVRLLSCYSFPISFCTSSHKRRADHATRNRMVCRSLRPQLPRLAIPSTLVQNGAASNRQLPVQREGSSASKTTKSPSTRRPTKSRSADAAPLVSFHRRDPLSSPHCIPSPHIVSPLPTFFPYLTHRAPTRQQQVGRNPFHARPQITSTS